MPLTCETCAYRPSGCRCQRALSERYARLVSHELACVHHFTPLPASALFPTAVKKDADGQLSFKPTPSRAAP